MGFIKTYRGKTIFTALLGIQIPLITAIYYFYSSAVFFLIDITSIFVAIILIDIVITVIVCYAIYDLLTPISLTSNILDQYFENNQLDNLSSDFQDDAGALIANTDDTLNKLEGAIDRLIHYDTLTGLPRRNLFQTYIENAIATKTANQQQLALIVLDLNNLKSINSTLGRQVGDLLLKKIAQRLNTYITDSDTLARFGGDEFAILRTNITDSDCLISLSNDLLEGLSQPFSLYGRQIHCDAKIGITIYPFDGITVQQLLQNADTAIYQAKKQELNSYQFYSPEISNKLKRTLAIKENLRYALQKNEFSIHYQPRVEIATGCLVGVEALLRWNNSELGWVSPNEFIPVAEETNLIMSIGEWVLRNACLQNKVWQETRLSPLRVSVNLSACQFKQKDLLKIIDRIIQETGINTAYLELEITESILVEDIEKAIAILWKLKRKGVSIALDDFGTGYSSLSYLQKLPINTLKIDRSFVTNLASSPDDIAIAKAIIALAQSLELNITAEGVETKAQFEYLKAQGCNEVQGYYFAKPLPVEALQDFLYKYDLNIY